MFFKIFEWTVRCNDWKVLFEQKDTQKFGKSAANWFFVYGYNKKYLFLKTFPLCWISKVHVLNLLTRKCWPMFVQPRICLFLWAGECLSCLILQFEYHSGRPSISTGEWKLIPQLPDMLRKRACIPETVQNIEDNLSFASRKSTNHWFTFLCIL